MEYNKYKQDRFILQSPTFTAFIPTLCYVVGLKESIILQQIHYLAMHPDNKNVVHGKKWCYCTYEQIHLWLPFESASSIGRTIRKLTTEKLLVVKNYNSINFSGTKNPKYYDQTKWYRVDYEMLEYTLERKFEKIYPTVKESLVAETVQIENIISNSDVNVYEPSWVAQVLGHPEDEEVIEEGIEQYSKLLEFIKEILSITYDVFKERTPDKSQLWQLEQSTAHSLCEDIKKLIEARQEFIYRFKKSSISSQDGYYALLLLLDITSFYAHNHNRYADLASFYCKE